MSRRCMAVMGRPICRVHTNVLLSALFISLGEGHLHNLKPA